MVLIVLLVTIIIIFITTYKGAADIELAAFYSAFGQSFVFIAGYIIDEIKNNKDEDETRIKKIRRIKRAFAEVVWGILKIIGIVLVVAFIFSFINKTGAGPIVEPGNTGNDNPSYKVITILNNTISGDFESEGEVDYYEYVPSVSGMYRFDFESDDVNTEYRFYLSAKNEDTDINSYFSRGGKNVELSAGEKYSINVEQDSGFPKYEIRIGVPNEISKIYGTNIEGMLSFEGQKDKYTYTAPVTGRYRFDFASDDDESNYKFNLYEKNNKQLVEKYYSDDGKTIDLVEGETYNIVIAQYSGFVSYNITIGEPKITNVIEENSFSGSLLFKDQKDCYTYIAPKTGRYRFDFKSDNDYNNYRFCLYTKNNKQLVERYYSDDGKTIDLEAGEEYRIEIVQYSGFENYTINIGVPNDISNIEGNVILGNLVYVDQENIYTYRADISGKYKFTFATNDANANYLFYVISPINEHLVSTDYRNKSKSVQLEEGQTYTVKVKQYSGFPEYQINIQLDEQ